MRIIFKAFGLWAALLLASEILWAQDSPKITYSLNGFIQLDGIAGQKDALNRVGEIYSVNDINMTGKPFTRMGLRRARLKGTIERDDWGVVAQLNIADNKIAPHTFMMQWHPASLSGFSLNVGLQDAGFGLESEMSAKSPIGVERATYISDLFPGNIDLAVEADYAPKSFLTLNASDFRIGLMGGSNGGKMRKNHPDLMARIAIGHHTANGRSWQVGAAGYWGYVAQNDGLSRVPRRYWSAFAQLGAAGHWGTTRLFVETMGGLQPGQNFTNSVTGTSIKSTDYFNASLPIFARPFGGTMAGLTYRIGVCPLETMIKYYYYDRNRNLSANDIAQKYRDSEHGFNPDCDAREEVWGAGLRYYALNDALTLTAYYEWVLQEKNTLPDPTTNDRLNNRRRNLFTLRLQYAF